MANCYGANSLTGGGTGALDRPELDGNILHDGDAAIVFISDGRGIKYRLNATSGASPDGINIIAPSVNPGTKRWLRLGITSIILTSDANGDLYMRSGDQLVRLPVGTAGQILEISGGIPSWQAGAMKKSEYDVAENGIVDKTEGIELGSDANGDTYYRNSSALQRLPIAANGSLLNIVSSLPAWLAAGAEGDSLRIASSIPSWETPEVGYGFAGAIIPYAGYSVPTGFLECDGSLINLTTYEVLFNAIIWVYGRGSGAAFIVSAATNFITAVSHGLLDNDVILFTNDGGALPGGLTNTQKFFVMNKTVDTFQVTTYLGGPVVDILDAGTGTHYFHIEVRVPDLRGEFLRGYDHGAGNDPGATISITGDIVSSSAVVTNISDASLLEVGMSIDGVGIPSDTLILTIDSATQITMDANATATDTTVAIICSNRTDRGDGSYRDSIGTKQIAGVKAHTHGTGGAHTHDIEVSTVSDSTDRVSGGVSHGAAGLTVPDAALSDGSHEHDSFGENENRPRNVYTMFCIKY